MMPLVSYCYLFHYVFGRLYQVLFPFVFYLPYQLLTVSLSGKSMECFTTVRVFMGDKLNGHTKITAVREPQR